MKIWDPNLPFFYAEMYAKGQHLLSILKVVHFLACIDSGKMVNTLREWQANFCLFYFYPGAAVHLASLLAAYGYIFSITDHHLMVKDDASYYRFQVCLTLHLSGNIRQGHILPLTVLLECQLTVLTRCDPQCSLFSRIMFWVSRYLKNFSRILIKDFEVLTLAFYNVKYNITITLKKTDVQLTIILYNNRPLLF